MKQEILNKYKEYDYLNRKNRPQVKILVNYIKPSFLFKSEILTPMHLGRAVAKEISKDGVISDSDLNWLHKNCIGDDDFEGNISNVNRRVGFLTGTYWAWKNYEKLGNPEYFGSFGYRRLLNPEFLDNIKDYELILPMKKNFKIETIKEQFSNYHGSSLFDNTMKVFKNIYPEEFIKLNDYFNGTSGYFDEIYVMKYNLFCDFCKWIFPLLFEYINQPQIIIENYDTRDIGFIIERITGYYLNNLLKSVKYKEVKICTTEKFNVNPSIINKDLLTKLRNNL